MKQCLFHTFPPKSISVWVVDRNVAAETSCNDEQWSNGCLKGIRGLDGEDECFDGEDI